jgi:hypothetical protein
MIKIAIETGPQWFEVVGYPGTLNPGEELTLTGAEVVQAKFLSAKPTSMGNPPEQLHKLSLAITSADLTKFAAGGFGGYELKAKDGRSHGHVHAKCKTKYAAQLFKISELQKMLNEAEKLIADAAKYKSDGFARQWFGSIATSKDELAKIHRQSAKLHAGVAGLSVVVFQIVGGEYLGAIDPAEKIALHGGGTMRILLGRGFSYTRYSWGEKVATIVHEMTHWFLDTIDDKFTTGFDAKRQAPIEEDAYGPTALRLTEDEAQCKKALNNADNWAYYICQYRSGSLAQDWRFFSESEMGSRGAFQDDPKNVDPLLVA